MRMMEVQRNDGGWGGSNRRVAEPAHQNKPNGPCLETIKLVWIGGSDLLAP